MNDPSGRIDTTDHHKRQHATGARSMRKDRFASARFSETQQFIEAARLTQMNYCVSREMGIDRSETPRPRMPQNNETPLQTCVYEKSQPLDKAPKTARYARSTGRLEGRESLDASDGEDEANFVKRNVFIRCVAAETVYTLHYRAR